MIFRPIEPHYGWPMAVREDVTFTVGASGKDRISAWFYRPTSDGPVPVLVMAHGLGAVKTMRLDAYAERFSAAGYACLVFDYRNFGDSEGQPRQLLDIKMQLEDWSAAVAYAHTLPGVDKSRITLWGTSLAEAMSSPRRRGCLASPRWCRSVRSPTASLPCARSAR